MWKKVWDFVEEQGMLRRGDRVVVAVSGGADSVCLLAVLAENRLDLRLKAVHVHHGLRGEEADRDAAFVEEYCKRLGVSLKTVRRNVAAYGKERGLSVEEAGRLVRYEVLEEMAKEWGEKDKDKETCVKIALAHHQDDNAETILHHLLRGSGLRGLSGIRAVQGNRIRPLLAVRRQEIMEYLVGHNLQWCEDSTNRSMDYTRNRIRNELIPYMTEQVNRRAVENILHAGRIFAQADQYLERQAERIWEMYGWVEWEGALTGSEKEKQKVQKADESQGIRAGIRLEGFLEQDPVIRQYLVRKLLAVAAPGQKNITAKHLMQIEGLAKGATGGQCDLPGDLRAVRTYNSLFINRGESYKAEGGKEEKRFQVELPPPCGGPVEAGKMKFRVFFREKGTEIPKKEYTKWFDYDKIKDTLCIRSRQAGDYLVLPGGGHKTLRRFLIDEKVPRDQRSEIVVLAEGNQILWVVGYRISEYYKVREDTHTILQVDFYGGKAYGG